MSINVYELVTNRIIEQLENNIIPWEKPWSGTIDGAFNRVSKKPYSILNQMLLKYDGEYASFKQWKDLGGHICKGEKSEMVVFWKMYPIKEKQDDGTEIIKTIPLLKYINVFHISQVDGVEPLKQKVTHDIEPIDKAEKILNDYWNRENITIEHVKGDKAFHESVHSTMKTSRCNRQEDRKGKVVSFGSEEYSKEELVAEIGSAQLMNMVGIETTKSFRNSTAYIQSWLKVLRNDNKFIVSASSKAEKAVNYILGIQ